jgi:hypothetical protein
MFLFPAIGRFLKGYQPGLHMLRAINFGHELAEEHIAFMFM